FPRHVCEVTMKGNTFRRALLVPALALILLTTREDGSAGKAPEATLPPGVKVVWSLDRAHRDKAPTRERICLNGLWRWQPAKEGAGTVPADRWGHFKVPGFWPGTTSYIQE